MCWTCLVVDSLTIQAWDFLAFYITRNLLTSDGIRGDNSQILCSWERLREIEKNEWKSSLSFSSYENIKIHTSAQLTNLTAKGFEPLEVSWAAMGSLFLPWHSCNSKWGFYKNALIFRSITFMPLIKKPLQKYDFFTKYILPQTHQLQGIPWEIQKF